MRRALLQVQVLALIGIMTAPAFTSAAGLLRLALPAGALAVAVFFLLRGDMRRYIAFCLWLFLLTPFIRRMVDFHAGFLDYSPLLLSPYAALAPSAGALAFAMANLRHPMSAGLLLVVAAAVYGLMLAALNGQFLPGAVDFLLWVLPAAFGMFVACNPSWVGQLRRDLTVFSLFAGIVLGLYALYQFRYMPGWDALWMKKTLMPTIGEPYPYKVRVFATMNSPASLALFLLLPLSMLIVSKDALRWVALALGFVALGLTAVRTAWVGIFIIGAYCFLLGSGRIRTSMLALALVLVVVAPMALLTDQGTRIVSQRIESMLDARSDVSANERLHVYSAAFEEMERHVFGSGLGGSRADPATKSGVQAMQIDSGPIAAMLAVGVVGALVYYVGIGFVVAFLFVQGAALKAEERALVLASQAIAVSYLVMSLLIPATFGEHGVVFWFMLGMGVAQITAARAKMRLPSQDRGSLGAGVVDGPIAATLPTHP
ncbi:O-antigen ligase family protein [Afifella aestuarii]|uniref:O-antigen ligase family protein n=1 Tax=Afifella aestuarii TaxID=1909496 RepID=UPI0013E39804|nr:O-antigen ligase family protein [Afifella aestuarii]